MTEPPVLEFDALIHSSIVKARNSIHTRSAPEFKSGALNCSATILYKCPSVVRIGSNNDLYIYFFPAYSIAKYGMSMCVLGMSGEFQSDGVAVNALWPKTGMNLGIFIYLTTLRF